MFGSLLIELERNLGILASRKDFIELGRRFRELKPEGKAEEIAFESYTRDWLNSEPSLGWEEVLKYRRVVVLGEPGSGKTWEFQQRAAILREQKHFSIFIRLDQLGSQKIDSILKQDELKAFKRWLRGYKDCTFFLDSVDETKFRNVSDFRSALDNFADAVTRSNLHRTRIVLSSRITEWQPVTDAYEFNIRFPQPTDEVPGQIEGRNNSRIPAKLLVVHIEPLTRTQVETFAAAQGVSDVEEFIAATDRAHAWEFARRPLDVSDLVAFWKARGKIGTLTELVGFDIATKLRPRSDRADFSLSVEDARDGAQWLAAASAFTRRFTFSVPEDLSTPSTSLDARDWLPASWSSENVRALCNRPLFDGASYGHYRFHHRRVGEYLAASWISDRMQKGCPEEELKGLFFENSRGRFILRPSLAPIAAWLCNGNYRWNQSLRTWVLKAAPGLHLKYGDPKNLGLEYKKQMLLALARTSNGRRRIWLTSSDESLSRLAEAALAPEISNLLLNKDLALDLRMEMVDLVRHGCIRECLDVLTKLLDDPEEPDDMKVMAARAVGKLSDEASCLRLLKIASEAHFLSNQLCASVIKALYPRWITGSDFAALLGKAGDVRGNGTDLPSQLRSHLENTLTEEKAFDLLVALIQLLESQPYVEKQLPVSAKFWWVGQLVGTVISFVLSKLSLQETEVSLVARGLFLLGLTRQYRELHETDFNAINQATILHPMVRREWFWRSVNESRIRHGKEPTTCWDVYGCWEVLLPLLQDLDWMIRDIEDRSEMRDRVVVLQVALDAWLRHDWSRGHLRAIQRAARSNKVLQTACSNNFASNYALPLKKIWWKIYPYRLLQKWWWRSRFRMLEATLHRCRERLTLLRHLGGLVSGKHLNWLAHLSREASEDSMKLSPNSWAALEEKRGTLIAKATKEGCKSFWRGFTPLLPHEKGDPSKIPPGLIVGLAGIQAELEDDRLLFSKLTHQEAVLAVRYAVNELNGPASWLNDLAQSHPVAVNEILKECIRGEWNYPPERHQVYDVLQRLTWQGEPYLTSIAPTVLELLQRADPPNCTILRCALTLLLQKPDAPLIELGQLATLRSGGLENQLGNPLWFAVWLQIDALPAISRLEILTPGPDSDELVVQICACLRGDRGDQNPLLRQPDYQKPMALLRLIPLVYRHVRFADDIHRTGTGSSIPEARDAAQDFRGMLIDLLSKNQDPAGTEVMHLLAEEPALVSVRDWVLKLLDERLEREAEMSPWNPSDLKSFASEHEVEPKSDKELFLIAAKRIRELKFDVEQSDNSLRDELHSEYKELHFRRWLARKLTERSRNRYNIAQEPEIDLQQRPDLRFMRPGIPGPVSVEAKLAEQWTVNDLLRSLQDQLVGQYLRDYQSRYGVYVLGFLGKKNNWVCPQTRVQIDFRGLVEIISAQAEQIVKTNTHVGDIAVIGIDFREPMGGQEWRRHKRGGQDTASTQ